MSIPVNNTPASIQEYVRAHKNRFLDICKRLVEFETPSHEPDQFEPAFSYLIEAFQDLGFTARLLPGNTTAGCLYCRPEKIDSTDQYQLLLGHLDTVWDRGTLEERPFENKPESNRAFGPGIFDMKAGLAQILIALECLQDLNIEPELRPLILFNTDEEIGSPESTRWIKRLARVSDRALVFEPSMGPGGSIKTARKGIGHFTVTIQGEASHAGLSPEKGSSAILELSHVIQALNELNQPDDGITVNVGVIEGGSRSNVVAASSLAEVDVRVVTDEQAQKIESEIRSIEPRTEDIELTVEGGFRRPPMERTKRNQSLWRTIRDTAQRLGLELKETRSGGGSDGNTASQYTATVDGLGAVGDGAHGPNEYIDVESTLNRVALTALVLLSE